MMLRVALIAGVIAAPIAAMAQSPCHPTQGFSGSWPPPSHVRQFWWDGHTTFLQSQLMNTQLHGFPNVPSSTAQRFSQLTGPQTEAMYNQLANGPETLLYQASPAYNCPFPLVLTKPSQVFLGVAPGHVAGVKPRFAAGQNGPPVPAPGNNYLWTRRGVEKVKRFALGVAPQSFMGISPGSNPVAGDGG